MFGALYRVDLTCDKAGLSAGGRIGEARCVCAHEVTRLSPTVCNLRLWKRTTQSTAFSFGRRADASYIACSYRSRKEAQRGGLDKCPPRQKCSPVSFWVILDPTPTHNKIQPPAPGSCPSGAAFYYAPHLQTSPVRVIQQIIGKHVSPPAFILIFSCSHTSKLE